MGNQLSFIIQHIPYIFGDSGLKTLVYNLIMPKYLQDYNVMNDDDERINTVTYILKQWHCV
jgi:hypothetical protein